MPTSANGDKVKQMIEGRLIAQGREPCNVQVVLGVTCDDEFYLQDLEGRFLMVERAAPTDEVESSEHESAGSQTETDALRLELETVKTANARLQDQLEQVKTRLQELSRTNCQCLAQYDELMAQQEAEISRLKGLLAYATTPSPDPVEQSIRPR